MPDVSPLGVGLSKIGRMAVHREVSAQECSTPKSSLVLIHLVAEDPDWCQILFRKRGKKVIDEKRTFIIRGKMIEVLKCRISTDG